MLFMLCMKVDITGYARVVNIGFIKKTLNFYQKFSQQKYNWTRKDQIS